MLKLSKNEKDVLVGLLKVELHKSETDINLISAYGNKCEFHNPNLKRVRTRKRILTRLFNKIQVH